MRLVVDSNIVFAGLLRDGVVRRLLVEPPFELLSPEWLLVEIRRHQGEIVRRAKLTPEEVDALLAMATQHLEVVPASEYAATMGTARARIQRSDPGDVPFLAVALARRCDGIWTQNTRDYADGGVDLWTTKRVVDWVRGRTVPE